MKAEPLELEPVSDATSMMLSLSKYKVYPPIENYIKTKKSTTLTTSSFLTTEPHQWSRLRMTYSFEYFIMKQHGKVLL